MKKVILNILSVLFGLLFVNAGLNKFLNYMPVPSDLPQAIIDDSKALMEIEWLLPLIACAEILGGLLIIFPKTRALGVLIVFPIAVGILLTHIFVAPSGLPIAIAIWAIMIWIIYENRHKYLPLVK